jgi:hypothetical protein
MPTILTFGGFRVVIYPNDHVPGHVHVIGADCEAVFVLNCPKGPPTLRESFGFTVRKLRSVAAHLEESLDVLCAAWEKIHGRNR